MEEPPHRRFHRLESSVATEERIEKLGLNSGRDFFAQEGRSSYSFHVFIETLRCYITYAQAQGARRSQIWPHLPRISLDFSLMDLRSPRTLV